MTSIMEYNGNLSDIFGTLLGHRNRTWDNFGHKLALCFSGWTETKKMRFNTSTVKPDKGKCLCAESMNDMKNDTFTTILRYPSEQVTPQVELMDQVASILGYCEVPRSAREIMGFLGLRDRKHFRGRLLRPLLERGLLRRTIPEKPRSRFQRYVAVR